VIDAAWNQYRGWAGRARSLQRSANVWSTLAMFSAGAAAVLGAVAAQLPAGVEARVAGFAAGAAAALTPLLGKDILEKSGSPDGSAPVPSRSRSNPSAFVMQRPPASTRALTPMPGSPSSGRNFPNLRRPTG
jgi:hypothetical protein